MEHLITGYCGYEHIQSEDDGAFNAAFFGTGQFVMEMGKQFNASIIDNNTVRIEAGEGMMFGRHFRIKPNTYEDVTITTGTAGQNRYDLIVETYRKDAETGVETCYLEVIEGTGSANAIIPAYTTGNILEGALFNQMPLYKVAMEGVVLKSVTPMFETMPTYKALAERYEQEFIQACETHLNSLNVLDEAEEVIANTQAGQIAGALAIREIYHTMLVAMVQRSSFKFDAETGTLDITL